MQLRIRRSHARSVGRNLSVALPAMALSLVLSGLAFGLSGNLGAGIGALLLTFVPAMLIGARLGRQLDKKRDAELPMIELTDEALVIPQEDGAPWVLPRAELKVGAGYYDQRIANRSTPVATMAMGVFLHVRGGGHDLVLVGDGSFLDAPERGMKKYKSPPRDKERPQLRVYGDELMALADVLGVGGG
ncbi:MAG: hypothetical protein H6741_01180 [Alphaproteobacteria bacterium]|nr:hypothetical protein [Alphaproteobacteria bacterium]